MSSFRSKIALISGLLTFALLIGSGFVLWELTSRMELARVDRELRNLGVPHLERVVGGEHWARFESALGFVAGTDAAPSFILRVRIDDRVVYQSPHWPDDLDPNSFPRLTEYEGPGAPRPGNHLLRPRAGARRFPPATRPCLGWRRSSGPITPKARTGASASWAIPT